MSHCVSKGLPYSLIVWKGPCLGRMWSGNRVSPKRYWRTNLLTSTLRIRSRVSQFKTLQELGLRCQSSLVTLITERAVKLVVQPAGTYSFLWLTPSTEHSPVIQAVPGCALSGTCSASIFRADSHPVLAEMMVWWYDALWEKGGWKQEV